MSQRFRVVHNPASDVDLTHCTHEATQRVNYVLGKHVDAAMSTLYKQGLPTDNSILLWQLVGEYLRRAADKIENTCLGEGKFSREKFIEPWACDECGNVNPANSEGCLGCDNMVVSDYKVVPHDKDVIVTEHRVHSGSNGHESL